MYDIDQHIADSLLRGLAPFPETITHRSTCEYISVIGFT